MKLLVFSNLLSLLAVVNYNWIIITACDKSLSIWWEVYVINPITVFSKYFRHSKTSNGTVDKFHSVRGKRPPFAKWLNSGIFTWWLHDVHKADPTRCSTWHKFHSGGENSCDKLAISWEGAKLEAFYFPFEENCGCGILDIVTLANK